ncbi:hypothetical protein E2C01_051096 [Portunus trituberculatus]|uniref:Uncharacterized protein n=1 Tax=Portunus trituberculatus TaxID=210409 RepID=A0A5B7GDV2_PORTR|nr:hypothetical protein [Portunus trituberculatus]
MFRHSEKLLLPQNMTINSGYTIVYNSREPDVSSTCLINTHTTTQLRDYRTRPPHHPQLLVTLKVVEALECMAAWRTREFQTSGGKRVVVGRWKGASINPHRVDPSPFTTQTFSGAIHDYRRLS